ncbi:hypothetical protein NLU13_8104 [Sarocladium strictum]|uniref:Uncharacterized protein n=1 Tax=Sarocladium strictum TaxID=5046 RepID=A0AA39GB22_SARSR|nr:hypothetical protein NLU13_8104 [Sarocladium strictum]
MPPEPPIDSFFENTVIAFEQCLFDKIHALIPADPPLTTFSPSKSRSIVFNTQNRCWCPTTLSDEHLHSKYNCPNRPFWKLAKNYKFNPCRHTPLYTSRCPTCIDVSGLARDFVRYAAHQDFANDPPDPDADMTEIEMFVLHYHGVGDTANVSPAALAEYTRQTKMLAYLVYLARSIEYHD